MILTVTYNQIRLIWTFSVIIEWLAVVALPTFFNPENIPDFPGPRNFCSALKEQFLRL